MGNKQKEETSHENNPWVRNNKGSKIFKQQMDHEQKQVIEKL